MRARHISIGRGAWIPMLAVVLASTVGLPAAVSAQGTGTLSGIVTVDAGEVQAFRVKARDTVGRIAYTVYTVEGRYRIYNLPSGTYELQVIEPGFAQALDHLLVRHRGSGAHVRVELAVARGADQVEDVAPDEGLAA